MEIKLITEICEIPRRDYSARESPERKALVKQAAKALGVCKKGQHVVFKGSEDRMLIANWVRRASAKHKGHLFTLSRIGPKTFGAWRTY